MSLEEQIKNTVDDAVKCVLGEFINELRPKHQDNGLITTAAAGKLLSCSSEYIRSLQDRGLLDLVFLPGSNHRRVLKSQIEQLIKENTIKTGLKKK